MQMERGTITLAVLWILRDRSEITGEGGTTIFVGRVISFSNKILEGHYFF